MSNGNSVLTADVVACARLRGARSQAVFDALLRAIAEPGIVVRLPRELLRPEIPRPLWLALALADVDVSIAVVPAEAHGAEPDGDAAASLVRDATGARIAAVPQADIVAFLGSPRADALHLVRVGDALAPERGARVGLAVRSLGDGVGSHTVLGLSGPGVPGRRVLKVEGLAAEVAARLGRASGDFPAGFDTWLFADDGAVAALPRSTHIDIEEI